jgi:hypothetical protein
MMSAHPAVKSAAHEVHADDFLAEPFDMCELIDKIQLHLLLCLTIMQMRL